MLDKKEETVIMPLWPEGNGGLFDPLGSYTGKTWEPDEMPVQDVDDL